MIMCLSRTISMRNVKSAKTPDNSYNQSDNHEAETSQTDQTGASGNGNADTQNKHN